MPISSRVTQRQLGTRLRAYRTEAGLSMPQVADELGWNKAKVSRIELARTGITQRDLFLLMDLYDVPQEGREELRQMAHGGRSERWWLAYGDFLTPAYADQIAWEHEARQMLEYQPLLMPSLVQTPEYARSVTLGGATVHDPDQADALVAIRLRRQQRLFAEEEEPLRLTAIITEAALMFRFCGVAVLRDQMQHLIDLAVRPNVTILAIPFSAKQRGAYAGGMIWYDFPKPSSTAIAFLETVGTSLIRDGDLELRRVGRIFDHLRAAAMPPSESVELIASRMEKLS